MKRLLEKDVTKRLGKHYGIYEILKHPWLKEYGLYQMLSKSIETPFKPDLLRMNFDFKEI